VVVTQRRESHVPETTRLLSSVSYIISLDMFKPSTKHNIQAGPSSVYAEVKLNGKVGNGNGQVSARYPYRLNL